MTTVDNTAVGAVQELLKTADGQKAFLEWIKSPVTQKMVAAAREMCQPIPAQPDLTAEYLLGLTVGGNRVLDFFTAPNAAFVAAETGGRMPQPTYGQKQIIERGEQ